MKDSLEARIAALPAVIASMGNYRSLLRAYGKGACCIAFVTANCDDDCLHGSDGSIYYYHGKTEPTPETLGYSPRGSSSVGFCPKCGWVWETAPLHATESLTSDFDEETERARLLPV